jgi:transposase-like protein
MELAAFSSLFGIDEACRVHLERVRWPDGPVCPQCGSSEGASSVGGRPGVYRCHACARQFTVTVGTPMHGSHLSLCLWYRAMYLTLAFTKGISSVELAKSLNVGQKTAWQLVQRIRAMQANGEGLPISGIVVEPMMKKRKHELQRHVIMAIDARGIVRMQAIKQPLTGLQKQLLRKMPEDIQHEVNALEPEQSPYRSARLNSEHGRGYASIDMPTHIKGFGKVMALIAVHAGCSTQTLYRLMKEFDQNTLQSKWRPKRKHARRPRGEVSWSPLSPTRTARENRSTNTIDDFGRRLVGPCTLEIWEEDPRWVMVRGPRECATLVRDAKGLWEPDQQAWFVKRRFIDPLIGKLQSSVLLTA